MGRPDRAPFVTLWREFVAQLFVNESVTSEVHFRQTVIWVFAFLLTPGIVLSLHVFSIYQGAVLRGLELVNQLNRGFASLFVTYSALTIGLIASFAWDALTFDKRDSMVLGALPLSPWSIIVAKVGALAVLLFGAAFVINALTAIPFAFVASGHKGLAAVVRHMAAHVTATMACAVVVFCAFVFIRGCLSWMNPGGIANVTASLFQFLLLSAVLSFVLHIPAMLDVHSGPFSGHSTNRLTPWIPTTWFVGLYEQLRDPASGDWSQQASRAITTTALAMLAAILVSAAGLRRQFQLAVAPSSSPTGRTGGLRAAARLLERRDPVAFAVSEFVLTTLGRSRLHQVPVAVCAAVGVVMSLVEPPAVWLRGETRLLGAPFMLAYFAAVGLRSAFFVPSDVRAAWPLRVWPPEPAMARVAGVRASILVLIALPTLVFATTVAQVLVGPLGAALHAALTLLVVVMLAEAVALSIDDVPFTRAYPAGHAKLRTRWPVYALGAYALAYGVVELELRAWRGSGTAAVVLGAAVVAAAVVITMARRRLLINDSAEALEPSEDEASSELTILQIRRV
jgi:hypothetical protein